MNLGSFDDARAAAEQVLKLKVGQVPLPPAPKPRRKRGEGRKPRVGKKAAPEAARRAALRNLPLVAATALVRVEVGSEAAAGAVVVPCYLMPE